MKLKVDKAKLRIIMRQRGVNTLKDLARKSGVSVNVLWREINRTGTLSRENLWLISDYLECPINDFVYPEWEDGA